MQIFDIYKKTQRFIQTLSVPKHLSVPQDGASVPKQHSISKLRLIELSLSNIFISSD